MTGMSKKGIKKIELLYFIALSFYLSVQMFSSTLISALFDFTLLRLLCFFIVVCLLTLKLIIENNYKHFWIYILILALFSFVGLRATNIRDLIILGYLTLEARNIDLRKIIKIDVILIGLVLSCALIMFFSGAFNSVDTTTTRSGDMIKRLSLGFGWTTYAPNYFFSLVIGVLCINPKKKNKWFLAIVAIFINFLLYKATNTKAAYYETLALIFLVILIDILKIDLTKHKTIRIFLPLTYIVCATFTIWLSVNFSNSSPVMRMINELTTYRLSLSHQALEVYPVGLLGNSVEWVTGNAIGGDSYFYVDSSYIQILIQYGILVFIYIVTLFTILMRHFQYRKNNIILLCLIMIAIHSITEPQLLNLAYNPFLLGLGYAIKKWRETMRIIKRRTLKNNRIVELLKGVAIWH